ASRSENDRNALRLLLHGSRRRTPGGDDDVGRDADEFVGERADAVGFTGREANIDPQITTFVPSKLRKRIPKGRSLHLQSRIVLSSDNEPPDPAHARVLRPRRQRPRRRRGATKEREEGAAVHGCPRHSITSSARPRSVIGNVIPSALALFM